MTTGIVLGVLAFIAGVSAVVLAVRPSRLDRRVSQLELAVGPSRREPSTAEPSLHTRLVAAAVSLAHRLTPASARSRIARQLDRIGNPAWDVPRVLSVKVFAGLAGLMCSILLARAAAGPMAALALIAGVTLFAWFVPDLVLRAVWDRQREALQGQIADAVDLLRMVLSGGTSMDAALRVVAENSPDPLGGQLRRAVHGIQVGQTRSDALAELADRTDDPDVRRVATAIVEAQQRGSAITDVLEAQSGELRIRRRQLAQERAHKVPTKMLFPMLLFVLPVILVIVMGPAVISIMQELGS